MWTTSGLIFLAVCVGVTAGALCGPFLRRVAVDVMTDVEKNHQRELQEVRSALSVAETKIAQMVPNVKVITDRIEAAHKAEITQLETDAKAQVAEALADAEKARAESANLKIAMAEFLKLQSESAGNKALVQEAESVAKEAASEVSAAVVADIQANGPIAAAIAAAHPDEPKS